MTYTKFTNSIGQDLSLVLAAAKQRHPVAKPITSQINNRQASERCRQQQRQVLSYSQSESSVSSRAMWRVWLRLSQDEFGLSWLIAWSTISAA